jgi:predicted HicB family RNase H-like nuclease
MKRLMDCGTSVNTMLNNQKILKYKGYEGYVHFSTEDNLYYGWIFGIKDLVDYNSETEDDIENQFRLAVDDYIEFKKEIGRDD